MAHITRTIPIVIVAVIATSIPSIVGAVLIVADSPARNPRPVGQAPRTEPPAAHAASQSNARTDEQLLTDHQFAVTATALTDEQQGLVDWAEERFALAGLELPELAIRFDPSGERCGTADGLYEQTSDGERIVTICIREGDTFATDLQRRRTLLHEFAHAWDFANLSDDDRDALGDMLGIERWNDDDAAWDDRGVERFAETFVYALLDQPRRALKVDLECTELVTAFRAATEAEPLGPGVPYCAS